MDRHEKVAHENGSYRQPNRWLCKKAEAKAEDSGKVRGVRGVCQFGRQFVSRNLQELKHLRQKKIQDGAAGGEEEHGDSTQRAVPDEAAHVGSSSTRKRRRREEADAAEAGASKKKKPSSLQELEHLRQKKIPDDLLDAPSATEFDVQVFWNSTTILEY